MGNERPDKFGCKKQWLPKRIKYTATIYADGKDADYKTNPQAYTVRKMKVTNKTKISQMSVPAGGFAISIIEEK